MERWELIYNLIKYLEANSWRPHIVLQTGVTGTCGIPGHLVKPDGRVVLNLSQRATGGTLRIGMYQCQASMTFSGQHCSIAFHPDAVEAVYSPDGGPKLVFPSPDPKRVPVDRRKPKLSLAGGTDYQADGDRDNLESPG